MVREDYRRYVASLGHSKASIATKALFTRTRSGNPGTYFSGLGHTGDGADLFLDPDSGLTERKPGNGWQRWKEGSHLAVSEVAGLARAHPQGLVLAYDHTVPHSKDSDAAKVHASSRVTVFQKEALAAAAWYWEREGALDPLVIVAVSATADRILKVKQTNKIPGVSGTA